LGPHCLIAESVGVQLAGGFAEMAAEVVVELVAGVVVIDVVSSAAPAVACPP
jgi:hypothetical protein